MNNVVSISTAIVPLREVQAKYALLSLSGEIRTLDREEIGRVLDGSRRGDISMFKAADAKHMIMRFCETLAVACSPKIVADEFKFSPNTMMYTDVAFSPLPTPDTTLNYWVGSTAVPAIGNWSVISNYLFDIVCDGDVAKFEYMLNYLAHMIQFPELKPGVMPVLVGGQGTGKGTFYQLLLALWGHTSLMVSNVQDVVGQFNAAMERNFVIFMDEAMFSGDRKAQDRLKSMITETTITVEQKFQPRRTITSYHRFFAASNHRHFAQVDGDDRRFLFLRVSDGRKRDHEYWSRVHGAIGDPLVIAALAHHLRTRDLTGFNVRDRPATVEHMEQKLRSLNGFDRFWFEVLQGGSFSFDEFGLDLHGWTDARFISTAAILDGCKRLAQGTRQFGSLQQRDLSQSLMKVCPSANAARCSSKGRQQRGYELPSLPQARAEFAAAMGGDIDWGDLDA